MFSSSLALSFSSVAPSGLSSLLVGPDLNALHSLNQQTILLVPLTVEPTPEPTPSPTGTASEPPPAEPTPEPTVTVTQTAEPSNEPQTVILDADQFGAGILGIALLVSFAAITMVRGFRR